MNRNDEISGSAYTFSDDEIVPSIPPVSEQHTIDNGFQIQTQPQPFDDSSRYTKTCYMNNGPSLPALDFVSSPTVIPTLHRSQPRQPPYNNSQRNKSNINHNISTDNGQRNALNTIKTSKVTRKVNVPDDVRNVMEVHVPISKLKNNAVTMRTYFQFMVKEK